MNRREAAERARAAQSVKHAERKDRLAELVADGMTIRAAAKQIGIGESTALAYWSQIKKELGEL